MTFLPARHPLTSVLGSLKIARHLTALALLAWLSIRLAKNLRFLRHASRQLERPLPWFPRVSVLIPARDEALTIAACVTSLFDQEYPDLEVLVLDDASTDGTGEQLDALCGRYPHLTVIHSVDEPPHGWTGKSYACHRLAEQATGQWLLFTDADTLHTSGSIQRGLKLATRLDVALLSASPYQDTVTWAERLLVSFIVDFLPRVGVDLEAMWRGQGKQSIANGQYLLAHATHYRTAGGHAAIRDALLDDFALARQFRAHGYAIALVDGTDLVSCRMYRTAREVWYGFSKNLLGAPAASSRRQALLWRAPLFAWCYACLFITPFFDAAFGARKLRAFGEVSWLLLLRGVVAWRLRRPPGEILTTPLAAWGVLLLGMGALLRRVRRQRIVWKGRLY